MQISSVFTRPAVHFTKTAKTNPPPHQTENKADVFQPAHTQTVRFGGAHEDKGLSEAINRDDETTAREWIAKGADIDAITEKGGTLLTLAVFRGKHPAIELLKKLGADMNKCDQNQWTPINLASFKGDRDTIEKLLQLGADPYVCNKIGQNAMTIAAATGQLDSIAALHQLKMNLNARDGWNNTPLVAATFVNQLPAIQLLHRLGADITLKLPNGMTLAEFAKHIQKPEAQKLIQGLLKVREQPLTDAIGNSFSMAERERLLEALFNDKPLADFILRCKKSSAKAHQDIGATFLNDYIHRVLKEKQPATHGEKSANQLVVELLYKQAGIPIPLELSDHKLTLNEAIRHHQPYLVNLILNELPPNAGDIILNKKDSSGLTALQTTVKTGISANSEAEQQIHIAQAKALLDHGADPLILDESGQSALDYLGGGLQTHVLDEILKHYKPASLNCLDQLLSDNTIKEVYPKKLSANTKALTLVAGPGKELRHNNKAPSKTAILKPGHTLEVDNKLYKVTPDFRLVKISDDADKVRFLFPAGIHDLQYTQGQIGDCDKLTEMQSLIDDPSGIGPRAVLDRFKVYKDRIELRFNDDLETFKMSELTQNDDDQYQYKKKDDEPEVVDGPLGLQLLERGNFRRIRKHSNTDSATEKNNKSDVASTTGTLNERITKKDHNWSSEFGIALLGNGFWKPVIVDGSPDRAMTQIRHWGRNSSKPFQDQNDTQKACIDDFIEQFRQKPSSFRGIVGTKYVEVEGTPTDEFRIPLENADEYPDCEDHLYTTHAYYLKDVHKHPTKDELVFQLRNPHRGGQPLYLSDQNFKKHIYHFDGIAPRVDGIDPQANGYAPKKKKN